MLEPGQDDTAKFLADHKVHVIASLPCYSPKNVNLQRGSGVFQRRYVLGTVKVKKILSKRSISKAPKTWTYVG